MILPVSKEKDLLPVEGLYLRYTYIILISSFRAAVKRPGCYADWEKRTAVNVA